MSSRKMIFGTLIVAVVLILAAAHFRKSSYNIVIPKVLSYPTTTLTFSSKTAIVGSPSVAADNVRVLFDNPNWAAAVSEAHLVTNAGGTYFKFTCQASSQACLEATRGSGSYTYSLVPSTLPAPSKKGTYALVWDVNPPVTQSKTSWCSPNRTLSFCLAGAYSDCWACRVGCPDCGLANNNWRVWRYRSTRLNGVA